MLTDRQATTMTFLAIVIAALGPDLAWVLMFR